MSVMGGLLTGQAPLRGRASLELLIRPFGYTDAARFWGADDPNLRTARDPRLALITLDDIYA